MAPPENTSHQPLINSFKKSIDLTDDETSFIIQSFEGKRVLKKAFLLQEGDICRHDHFILNGCFRSFLINKNGDEHTLHFAIENWWITDLSSLVKQEPSQVYIQALESSQVLQIDKPGLERIYAQVPAMERFFRILHQRAYIAQNNRIMDNIALQGKARYEKFSKEYPGFVQRIPQKYIASYLGMTPVFLSKIRGRQTKN